MVMGWGLLGQSSSKSVFLLWRWSLKGHSSVTLGRYTLFIVQVSWNTECIKLVELYLEDHLEMAGYQWHLGRDCAFIGQVFWDAALFQMVEFFLGGLEVADHSFVTWKERLFIVAVKVSWDRALWSVGFYSEDGLGTAVCDTGEETA